MFDFDGTLADTFTGIERCVNIALSHFDLPVVDQRRLRPTIGLRLDELFRTIIDTPPSERLIADLVGVYREWYPVTAPGLTTLFPGVLSLLETLTQQGMALAMATSKARSNILPILAPLGIGGYFEVVCSDDLVRNGKPHPEMLNYISARLDVPTERMLVVGDTLFDIEMGNAAGAATCAVTWGNHSRARLTTASPTYVVDTMPELEAAIGQITSS